MTIKDLQIHSFVDVITNSSSVIYVQLQNNTESLVKEMINAILKATGETKTADDLFTFKVAPCEDFRERWIGERKYKKADTFKNELIAKYKKMHEEEPEFTGITSEIKDSIIKQAYKEAEKAAIAEYEKNLNDPDLPLEEWCVTDDEYEVDRRTLIIEPKNGEKAIDIKSLMSSMFYIESYYDG